MQNLSSDFRQRLSEQSMDMQNQMNHQREQFDNRIDSVEAYAQREFSRVDSNLRAINDQVNAVATDFNNRFQELAQQQMNEQQHAQVTVAELGGQIDAIRGLHPEKFSPGELSALDEQFQRATGCLNNQQYQAALAIAQVRLTDASRLLARLNLLNTIFYERLMELRRMANTVIQRIAGFETETQPTIEFNINEEQYELDYDINYWTSGRFDNIRRQMNQISQHLESAETNPEIDINCLEHLDNEIQHINESISMLDELGRNELLRSYAVGDMAVRVHNSFAVEGWRLINSGRHEEDERKPYTFTYEDVAGNQVALVVNTGNEPEETSLGMEVYSSDYGNEDSAYNQEIRENLIENLRSGGIPIEHVERRNDCAQNPTADTFVQRTSEEVSRINEARLQTEANLPTQVTQH